MATAIAVQTDTQHTDKLTADVAALHASFDDHQLAQHLHDTALAERDAELRLWFTALELRAASLEEQLAELTKEPTT